MFKNYDLDQTITMAQRVAVKHICIRSNLLPMNSSTEQIKKKALLLGMHTLRRDGWEKVLEGITTPAEVIRVTQQEEVPE